MAMRTPFRLFAAFCGLVVTSGCQNREEQDFNWQCAKRGIAEALGQYRISDNDFPPDLLSLTTPIAYLSPDSRVLEDPYLRGAHLVGIRDSGTDAFMIWSVGPDGVREDLAAGDAAFWEDADRLVNLSYDPTNGADSRGDRFLLMVIASPANEESRDRLTRYWDSEPHTGGNLMILNWTRAN